MNKIYLKKMNGILLITWSAILFPTFKFLDQRFSLALVCPPIRYMGPQFSVAVGNIVLV